MGANQSNNDMPKASQLKLEEENKLLREKIKNQALHHKLQILQNMIQKQRMDNVIQGKNPNHLLTNPQIQNEFLKNKKMQEAVFNIIAKEKSKEISDNQYQEINNYLTDLNIIENETDNRKPYLYTNEPSNRFVNQNESKKPEIGISLAEREKFVRLLKKEKEEQKNKMENERNKRKNEYESSLYSIKEDSIDPYKILEVSKNASFSEIKSAFKKKAKIYHPDRLGGNTNHFQLLTKAFMLLVEKYKKEQADKQFMTLKDESRRELEKQQNESKKNVNFKKINMSGNNFNPKKFNKIFQDNRLYNPNDEGYKNWMDESDYESLKVPKLDKNSYNKQSFNEQFQNHKKQFSKQIVKREEPKALPSLKQNCEELGQGVISDYSGKNCTGRMEYTDYKKAHTETTLIDIDSIDYREYKNLDDLQKERAKKMYLSKDELERIKMQEMLEKQREEERLIRLNKNDEATFRHFEKVNKMFIQ